MSQRSPYVCFTSTGVCAQSLCSPHSVGLDPQPQQSGESPSIALKCVQVITEKTT